ncbi:MAG: hypothetical protein BWY47_00212 [Bacteroidetes bacterium ADurb.Bin302]|nr:MAG: hypothetical protein BWY47_00212 [Bacteroidetes bacterium ADurb.Bin302]
MKNKVRNKSVHYVLLMIIVIAWSIQSIQAESPYQQYNQENNNSSGYLYGIEERKTVWGDQEAFRNNSSSKGTRSYAPALPDEPGASCVPIPDGLVLMLVMAVGYGLTVSVIKRKGKTTEK